MAFDPLPALRERIYALVMWFREEPNRLVDAQDARAGEKAWDAIATEIVDGWMRVLEAGSLPDFAAAETSGPLELLRDLECLDELAWLIAGRARLAPPQVFGKGDHEYYVIRLASARSPRAARQPGRILTHLRYHALVPTRVSADVTRSYKVRIELQRAGLERCQAAHARGRLVAATTSFGDDAPIQWSANVAVGVPTAEARAIKLSQAIAESAAFGVDVLVAPELTVPPDARAAVQRRLQWADDARQLALLVPGSFHERIAGRTYNRAILLDGRGNQVSEHRKLTRFGEVDGWVEQISLGEEITVVLTPIGMIALAICLDFCDDHVGRIWEQLQPEWLFVPAYGSGASAHERAAHRCARMAATVTVLAHEVDGTQGEQPNSFVHHRRLVPDVIPGAHHAPDFFYYHVDLEQPLKRVDPGTRIS